SLLRGYGREVPSFPDLPHVIDGYGTEGNGAKRLFEFVRDVADLPHHRLAHVPRYCVRDELVAGIGYGDRSPAWLRFQIAHEPLRSLPVPQIKGLADVPSVQDSLDPDGTLAVSVLARLEFAFREMPTKDRKHSVVKASCSNPNRRGRKRKAAEIA